MSVPIPMTTVQNRAAGKHFICIIYTVRPHNVSQLVCIWLIQRSGKSNVAAALLCTDRSAAPCDHSPLWSQPPVTGHGPSSSDPHQISCVRHSAIMLPYSRQIFPSSFLAYSCFAVGVPSMFWMPNTNLSWHSNYKISFYTYVCAIQHHAVVLTPCTQTTTQTHAL